VFAKRAVGFELLFGEKCGNKLTIWRSLHGDVRQSRRQSSISGGKKTGAAVLALTRARPHKPAMSASLIGRLGSSAFRLSAIAVSMSLAGSCFSSESAPGPFHHGIRGRGGTIFYAALPLDKGQVQADMRTHLIHRPARDIFPRPGGSRVFSYRV